MGEADRRLSTASCRSTRPWHRGAGEKSYEPLAMLRGSRT